MTKRYGSIGLLKCLTLVIETRCWDLGIKTRIIFWILHIEAKKSDRIHHLIVSLEDYTLDFLLKSLHIGLQKEWIPLSIHKTIDLNSTYHNYYRITYPLQLHEAPHISCLERIVFFFLWKTLLPVWCLLILGIPWRFSLF